jgi:peptidoglycan/LPS O-acetylase OafA/YrhL
MFTLGMLAAYVTQSPREQYLRLREKVPWGWIAAGAFFVAAALTRYWGWAEAVERFPILDFPVGIMAACLLVVASRESSPWAHIFSWKPMVFMGTFSYSVYLVHAPLLQLLWQYVVRPAGLGDDACFYFLMTAGFAAVLAGAYLFFRLFELPFMRTPVARRREAATVPAS